VRRLAVADLSHSIEQMYMTFVGGSWRFSLAVRPQALSDYPNYHSEQGEQIMLKRFDEINGRS